MKTLDLSTLEAASGGLSLNNLGSIGSAQPAPIGSPVSPNNPFQLGGADPFASANNPFASPYGGFDPYHYAVPTQGAPSQCSPCAPSPCHPDQGFAGFAGFNGAAPGVAFDPFGQAGAINPSANGPVAAGSTPFGSAGGFGSALGGPVASPDGWGNPFGAASPVGTSSPVPANLSPGGFNPTGSPFGTF